MTKEQTTGDYFLNLCCLCRSQPKVEIDLITYDNLYLFVFRSSKLIFSARFSFILLISFFIFLLVLNSD